MARERWAVHNHQSRRLGRLIAESDAARIRPRLGTVRHGKSVWKTGAATEMHSEPAPGKTMPFYFSFTNSKTKIAHTPTVTGNCTNCASCSGFPRGSRNVSKYIVTAVSIPRISFDFQFMVVSPLLPSPNLCFEVGALSAQEYTPGGAGSGRIAAAPPTAQACPYSALFGGPTSRFASFSA